MERFVQLVIDGIAIGSIYGALALALVLIFRSTGLVNFAQGEMAMFSTFVAWGLTQAGIAVGFAILITLALSGPASELAASAAMQEEYLGVPIGGRAGVPQPPMEEER